LLKIGFGSSAWLQTGAEVEDGKHDEEPAPAGLMRIPLPLIISGDQADGVDCSYICDVAIFPSHQGPGFGKNIISKLIELSVGHKKSYCTHTLVKKNFIKNQALNA